MLEALKQLNGGTIYLPGRVKDRPDRNRLALRLDRLKALARDAGLRAQYRGRRFFASYRHVSVMTDGGVFRRSKSMRTDRG